MSTSKVMNKFSEAINVAMESRMISKHGAVLVKGGKTLSASCNNLQPIHNVRYGCWQHAEIATMLKSSRHCVLRPKRCKEREKQY